jgi:hypothetical protein
VKLTLDALREIGAFTGEPVEREVTWTQGDATHTATVYVRPLSYKSAVSDITSVSAKGDPIAGRIAASICDENGVAVFTVGDITGEADPERGPISSALTMALLQVIGEVNGLGKP